MSVFRKRALSTLSALEASLSRRLAFVAKAEPTDALDSLQRHLPFGGEEDDVSEDERRALTVPTGLPHVRELAWLRRLQGLAITAVSEDAKVEHLRQLLSRTRESVVVFTEFRRSLQELERRLRTVRTVTVLHGGQTRSEQWAALTRFATGAATVLIATDVAGQGLNLQHAARWVICMDLPWNPARLEQRMGRVDRIGQRRTVHLTVLLSRHAGERAVLSRFATRLSGARRSVGASVMERLAPPAEETEAISVPATELHEPPPGETMRLSTDWRRAARAVARVLAVRRTLGARWRGPYYDAHRPWVAHHPGGLGRLPLGNSHLIVVSIPILDGSGTELERRTIVFAASSEKTRSSQLIRSTALQAVVHPCMQARVRRVTRLIRALCERRCAIERAIADELRRTHGTRPSPQDLFGRRGTQEFERTRADVDQHVNDIERRIDEYRSATTLLVGTPRVDFILDPRR